ncbi:MAG: hypothetical protein IT448_11765 [Phycisphaerales bacterium]|nr:hypothetical protein [Phycisphaerales bacterium]
MTSRRSVSKHQQTTNQHPSVLESLEQRRLLTTLHGGDSFIYKDASDNLMLIRLSGNIEAEFLAAVVNPDNNFIHPSNLVPGALEDADGADLFAIYVTRADLNSYISVVQVDDEGHATPFGDPVSLNVRPASGGDWVSVSGAEGSGAGFLGARTVDLEATANYDESDRPLLAMGLPVSGWGVIPPQPGNYIKAGLSVNNGYSLGRFVFDGTITGFVNYTGSANDFYAGNLFTGDARGSSAGQISFNDNFNVAGDIRNILIKGFVGTDGSSDGLSPDDLSGLNYWTGVDVQVRGTLGQFRAASHIATSIDVRNALAGPFLTSPQQEIEYKIPSGSITESLPTARLGARDPAAAAFFNNDTFDTPQILASVSDPVFGGAPGARVVGNIRAIDDPTDFYGLALLAGEKVQVSIVSAHTTALAPIVGVYDPDGRFIASNFNDRLPLETLNQPFQFTADRPGIYRFAVGEQYLQAGIQTDDMSIYGDYSLRIQNNANIALGGVVSDDGNILSFATSTTGPTITVWRGDFGAMQVGNTLMSFPRNSISVPFGNLRAVVGENLAWINGDTVRGVNFSVPYGTVGLLQSTDGDLAVNPSQFDSIGGNFQIIDAGGTLYGNLYTRQGIGVIRAHDVDNNVSISVNTDNSGRDGMISLIDVSGNWGTRATSGPRIDTNAGGNVGYVRIGGQIRRDGRFGSGLTRADNTFTVPAGQSINITDDSGIIVNIAPNLRPNPQYIPGFVNPSNPNDLRMQPYLGKPANFTVTTLPIYGSGGSAIVNVTSDRSLVFSSNNPSRDLLHTEIGQVVFTAGGAPVIMQPVYEKGTGPGTRFPNEPPIGDAPALDPNAALDVSLYVQGPSPISILETAFGAAGEDDLDELEPANMIQNVSGGDMPIIRASSIGNLYGSSIGTARLTTASTSLLPGGEPLYPDEYPFINERLGVLTGNVINIAATQQIGNVSAGLVGSVVPNSDNIDLPYVFEGLVGTIKATELRYVDIGEGLATGGTGYANQAGLFASGQIRVITNRDGGDIRGPIVSQQQIGGITLNNGSIINTNIGVVSSFPMVSNFSSSTSVTGDMGPITVRGNGGIIGTAVRASNIASIYVPDGFGIFTSGFHTSGTGRIERVVAGGYGLRNVTVSGGGSITQVNATGTGGQLDSALYSSQVRLSELGYRVDPNSGTVLNRLNDLHAYLGTTKNHRTIENVTNSGIIEDTTVNGAMALNAVYANRIRRSSFSFANSVDLFQTRGPIRDVTINTGRLNKAVIGGDVADTLINVSGPITDFYVVGSIDAGSTIRAIGGSGSIGRFQTLRSLAGDIQTTGIINTLAVKNDILATSRIEAEDILTRYIGGTVFGQIVIG